MRVELSTSLIGTGGFTHPACPHEFSPLDLSVHPSGRVLHPAICLGDLCLDSDCRMFCLLRFGHTDILQVLLAETLHLLATATPGPVDNLLKEGFDALRGLDAIHDNAAPGRLGFLLLCFLLNISKVLDALEHILTPFLPKHLFAVFQELLFELH